MKKVKEKDFGKVLKSFADKALESLIGKEILFKKFPMKPEWVNEFNNLDKSFKKINGLIEEAQKFRNELWEDITASLKLKKIKHCRASINIKKKVVELYRREH